MKGLLIKDFKLMKGQKNYFAMLFIICIIMSISMSDTVTFVIGYMSFFAAMFTLSTVSYDEFDNGNAFLFSLPITRKIYAIEKYIFGLIVGGCALLLSTMVAVVSSYINNNAISTDILLSAVMLLPALCVFLSVMMPFQLKYGAEKSRMVMFITIGCTFLFVFGVSLISELFGIDLGAVIKKLSMVSVWGIAVLFYVFAVLVLLFSCRVSIRIMEKKEL